MRWPGQVYDGEAARKSYAAQLRRAAAKCGAGLVLPDVPLHSLSETDAWLAEAKAQNADGLMLILLDRQEHAWPSAHHAAETGLPTVVFSPLGSCFTTNTAGLADRDGVVIYATDDFSQPAFGLQMFQAAARLRASRCLCIKGTGRSESRFADIGLEVRRIPASEFLEEYRRTPETPEVLELADYYFDTARRRRGATRQDAVNGVKSYIVAGRLLEREEADGITMDCLGALGSTDVSLPCIAWSRMNDDGIPAACEADMGAVAAQFISHYLLNRPGFQQDPVPDTSDDTLIGAHCSCPTRLNGFAQPSEPFDLVHHHGERDAVPRTIWGIGAPVTCFDVLPGAIDGSRKTELLISEGKVVDNMEVPPSGGCVVSVKVKFAGKQQVLAFPGFHQLFLYGHHGRKMQDFCQLMGLKATVV